jgi:hypothetical protein
MSSELLQVEMGKREIGKGGGGFYTPSHRKESLQLKDSECPGKSWKLREVRRLRVKPGNSNLPRSAP